ncbi:hypothetical protein Syun_004995 [Stephania yunnanensis]|uniref:Uncharacterized protein n=1 Tax=Stephania yunnanensis TaxID=152371 RepID=A0AAP0Q1T6_9MAGN
MLDNTWSCWSKDHSTLIISTTPNHHISRSLLSFLTNSSPSSQAHLHHQRIPFQSSTSENSKKIFTPAVQ